MKFGKNMRRQSFVSVRLNIWIRRCAVKVSHLFGIHLERDVKKDQIVEFISTIHPLTTNHSLIRVGGDGDGGYLVPDDLDGFRLVFQQKFLLSQNLLIKESNVFWPIIQCHFLL